MKDESRYQEVALVVLTNAVAPDQSLTVEVLTSAAREFQITPLLSMANPAKMVVFDPAATSLVMFPVVTSIV